MLMTPCLLYQGVYTTVYELRRGFMTLANINCCVSSRAWRGVAHAALGSYQLSVFRFQIVTVFSRIRIVHLAHYSVRFEFESNIRYRPSLTKDPRPLQTLAICILQPAVRQHLNAILIVYSQYKHE